MILEGLHIGTMKVIEPMVAYFYDFWGFIIGANLLFISFFVRKIKKYL